MKSVTHMILIKFGGTWHRISIIYHKYLRFWSELSALKPQTFKKSSWMYSLLNNRVTISVSQTHCSPDSFPRSILPVDSFFGWNFSTDSFSAKVRIISRGHTTNNLSITRRAIRRSSLFGMGYLIFI
jgi:hypothetical protein